MVVIADARQTGLLIKMINNEAIIMMIGMILNTMVLYSFKALSIRINSEATKSAESLL